MPAEHQTVDDEALNEESFIEADEADEFQNRVVSVVGDRVRSLRTEKNMTMQQFAAEAGISSGMLFKIEHGQTAASVATLCKVASAAGVPLTALFRNLDEEHDVVLVKAGRGLDIFHEGASAGRRYQDLGALRGPSKVIEPVLITLTERDEVFPVFQHAGIEMLFMVSGSMEYAYGSKTYLLEQGDSLQFKGEVGHGPARLIELPVQFLSTKVYSI